MGALVSGRTSLTNEVILNTPWLMLGYVHVLHGEIPTLRERIEQFKAKLKQSSTNSNKPPSSDSPFTTGKESVPKKPTPRKRVKGLGSNASGRLRTEIFSGKFTCGCDDLAEIELYYIHQVVELPETELDVTHHYCPVNKRLGA